MSERARFAAISCVHVGAESRDREDALVWLKDVLTNHQNENGRLTHFILLGDLFDACAASVHPKDEIEHTLDYEFEQGSNYLKEIRSLLDDDCKTIWTLGNHDDNIRVADARRIPRELRTLCDWNRYYEFGEEFRRWQQIPYQKPSVHKRGKGCYELGQVILCHGFDCAQNSDELEGLQINYALGGHSWRLCVRGHTHRPMPVSQAKRTSKVLLPFYYANAGTMGDLMPTYMVRKDTSQWNAGVVVGDCQLGRVSRMNGKCWDATTIIK